MLFTVDLANMPIEAESRMIIRFQDCDPLMHLNNSKYFDYFFNAREDQVSKLYGFSYEAMFRELRTSWVVYQHQIAYVRPAKISEWVRITSRVIHYNEDTMVTEYFMTNDQKTELKTVLWSTSKHVSIENGRRVPHPQPIMEYLQATCVPGIHFEEIDFNQRIHAIKQELTR
ncbi:acyl-CoA thioester hydrolase [Dyadobacter jejuensis]|uniref:Acyl-CoA thioester hydrolase n=1 Tax=Dyadobacter jejuensis TaxID=1082580 RepID=A0A316ATA5_9BACT|nr:acyl-CoA thioesterase [Dyadobacter jejuensis]PWJ60524.1 acyl-CoA thioester hydrolase [Dyadobacter jejuensis]